MNMFGAANALVHRLLDNNSVELRWNIMKSSFALYTLLRGCNLQTLYSAFLSFRHGQTNFSNILYHVKATCIVATHLHNFYNLFCNNDEIS